MQEALARQLATQPGVRSWAFSDATPGDGRFERRGRVEGDGLPADSPGLPVVTSQVEPGFFSTLGIESLHGRTFERGDVPVEAGQTPTRVLVNTKFLDRRGMDYRSAVGRTMRISDPGEAPTGPWMEIVGVVPDLEASLGRAIFDGTPMAYLPAAPGGVHPLTLVIDLGDDPTAFAPVLRRLLADADPTVILSDVVALDELPNGAALVQRTASGILVGLSLIAIVLSTAALYALMSFTVARRTREIGVRIALGGKSSRIVASIARRPLRQLMFGVMLGTGFWAILFHAARRDRRVPGRARGRRAVVAGRAVDHGRDRRDDRPVGLPRANAERTQDPPGGGAAGRRVVGLIAILRLRLTGDKLAPPRGPRAGRLSASCCRTTNDAMGASCAFPGGRGQRLHTAGRRRCREPSGGTDSAGLRLGGSAVESRHG